MERNQSNFIAEYGAPKIELADIAQFKNDKNCNLVNKIKARLDELQKEYKELEALYNYNSFLERFEHNFVPVSGHEYYLYQNEERFFMSLIHPDDFVFKYIFHGTCRYTGQGYFEKVN